MTETKTKIDPKQQAQAAIDIVVARHLSIALRKAACKAARKAQRLEAQSVRLKEKSDVANHIASGLFSQFVCASDKVNEARKNRDAMPV